MQPPQSMLCFIRVDLVFLFLLRYRTLTKTPSFHGFMHSPLAEFNTCKRDFLVCNSVYLCEISSSLFQHLYFGLIRKNCETSDRAIWGKIHKILTFSDVTSQQFSLLDHDDIRPMSCRLSEDFISSKDYDMECLNYSE